MAIKESGSLVRLNLTISEELLGVLDSLCYEQGVSRNSFIETLLRKCPPVKKEAELLGITFQDRPAAGRPRTKG